MTRNWCFTLNNYSDSELDDIANWDNNYTIFGQEVGKENTPHLQGFTIFKKPQRLTAVKKVNARAHWEGAKGSWEQNVAYCSKDGIITEYGTKPMSRKRQGEVEAQRWEAAWKLAKEGKIEEIDADIRIRCYNTFKHIRKDYMTKPEDAEGTTGIWIYGEPGCGKSRKARLDFPGAYDKMQNKWWDGYQGEENVILDDFDSKELGHHLKIWADRYSFVAETKGGAINIRPKAFVITSNYSPDDSKFEWDDEMRGAIKRRFKIIHIISRLGGVAMHSGMN